MKKKSAIIALLFSALMAAQLNAVEYYVGKQGSDTNDGLSREKSFLTIQRGVDALKSGDTLAIGPGEYSESVQRDGLGTNDVVTAIRAEIPGTVVLRGDVPVEGFRKVAGARMTWVADLAATGEVAAVNEVDTLKIFERMPNSAELDYMPGFFHHDRAAGKLYLSTSDMKAAEAHRYTATVIAMHGLYLSNARGVVIEGLVATGFNALQEIRGFTLGSIWGLFIANGKDCVIRNCSAYLNGNGIGLNSTAETSGDNTIENCAAWANAGHFGVGDRGGITLIETRRDIVRDCVSFLNGEWGINIRGGLLSGQDEKFKSSMVNSLAWGNGVGEFKIKTGSSYVHHVDRCVGMGGWSLNGGGRSDHCLIGLWNEERTPDNIKLEDEKGLNLRLEFADPDNRDYRLQATSRFRGTAPGGKDRGPFQYEKNIYYVKAGGSDTADGLSVSNAWKTISRAAKKLKEGDTLYIEPGVYEGDLEFGLKGGEGKLISISGRGLDPVIIRGGIFAKESSRVAFKRLYFNGEVKLVAGKDIVFDNCLFNGAGTALSVEKVDGLKIAHCAFTGFKNAAADLKECSGVFLEGNLYDNRDCAALRLDATGVIRYSDYNSYRKTGFAWEAGGKVMDFPELQKAHDRHSRELVPEYAEEQSVKKLKNAALFAACGPLGRPVGLYRDEKRGGVLELVEKPKVYSLSATTANIEWMTSLPATCELAWGDTPECHVTNNYDVNCFGTYSLTGLKPGQTYYFRVNSMWPPEGYEWMRSMSDLKRPANATEFKGEALCFTTPKASPAAVTYYVAPDGKDTNSGLDRQNAFRTIQQAADKVNAGDTVLVAGGKYQERVRVLATGESNALITFKAIPGEKVVMDGADRALNSFFMALGKSSLRFDGFYFTASNRERLSGWFLGRAGEFKLYRCKDIEITRCFADGRGGYSAEFIIAWQVENLRIRNCVHMNKFGGTYFARCPGLLIEHSVFARPMISSFLVRNETNEAAAMNRNIFTDNLKKKADLNIMFMAADYKLDAFSQSNNCYLVRSFPSEKRMMLNRSTIGEQGAYIHDPLFADPSFAGDPSPTNTAGFPPDRMMDPNLKLDFKSFFATNPEVVKRGIGLQPEAFKDFKFDSTNRIGN
jgi:hypothetical protein